MCTFRFRWNANSANHANFLGADSTDIQSFPNVSVIPSVAEGAHIVQWKVSWDSSTSVGMTDTADKNPRNPRLKTICAICVPIHPHCARIKKRLSVIPLFLVSFSSLFPLFHVSFQIRPEAKGKLSVYEEAMSIYEWHTEGRVNHSHTVLSSLSRHLTQRIRMYYMSPQLRSGCQHKSCFYYSISFITMYNRSFYALTLGRSTIFCDTAIKRQR